MKKSIFNYSNYKPLIVDFIESMPQRGRGQRSSLANFIGCQNTYLSRVINGDADLSFEQAEGVSRFFHLPKIEKRFFLLLFQYNRSSTKEARGFLRAEMDELKKESLNFKKRLEIKEGLTESEMETYYSSWLYSAVHMLSSLKTVNQLDDIAKLLRRPKEDLEEIFHFLIDTNLITWKNGKVSLGTTHLHVGEESHLVAHHHRNWRVQALHAISESDEDDVHYSSVVSLSKADAFKIKNDIVEFVKSVKQDIRNSSPEEECYSFCLDFFQVGKTFNDQ